MACDLSVMADSAYIYQAFAAISLVPDGGATWHLAHLLGRKRAYEFIATGEKVSAGKCLDLGLCNRVVPADTLMPETLAWAAELADKAPLALQHAKAAVNFAMDSSLADTIDREADLQHLCVHSEDAKEGVRAFREKRPARFKGC
jgi:2-(1,2-epoxy-1,2-dihydrophenyl)acetyl-CoA isomerase